MDENNKMYLEMNQLRVEKQANAPKIEVLQEESYMVTMTLATPQSISS
jgi:hypothetical protein